MEVGASWIDSGAEAGPVPKLNMQPGGVCGVSAAASASVMTVELFGLSTRMSVVCVPDAEDSPDMAIVFATDGILGSLSADTDLGNRKRGYWSNLPGLYTHRTRQEERTGRSASKVLKAIMHQILLSRNPRNLDRVRASAHGTSIFSAQGELW